MIEKKGVAIYSRLDGSEQVSVYDLGEEISRLKFDPVKTMVDMANNAESEIVKYNAASKIFDHLFSKNNKDEHDDRNSAPSISFNLMMRDPESAPQIIDSIVGEHNEDRRNIFHELPLGVKKAFHGD